MKEVKFVKYCPECRYLKTQEEKEPCVECLETPAREDTERPVKFQKR